MRVLPAARLMPVADLEAHTAETWGLALHPRSLHLATTAGNATVRVMSSASENFVRFAALFPRFCETDYHGHRVKN